MGDAGGEGEIERVHVERDVDGSGEVEMRWVGQILYFENFPAVFFRLLVLVCVQGADADLDEAVDELDFHDSGERAGVGVGIAFVIGVEIGMGVEMDERDAGDLLADAAKNWVSDGVVAAEADGTL